MIQAAIFAYAMLAFFVLASAERNKREQRPHGAALVRAGTVLMSMSLTFGALLAASLAYASVAGGPLPAIA